MIGFKRMLVRRNCADDCPDSELDYIVTIEELVNRTHQSRFSGGKIPLNAQLQMFLVGISSSTVDPD